MEEVSNEHLDRKEKQIDCLNKWGAYIVPFIAIVAWIVGMSYFFYIGGGFSSVEFGDFATHPIFMSTAFLLFGTLTVSCHRICEDLGFSLETAKWIQISLNTLVLVFAWTGWEIIYELHNSSAVHYKGSHSRVGVFALSMWVVHYISGFLILFCVPEKRIETMLDIHYIFGTMCIIVALWTIALGLMWEEYSYDADQDGYGRSTSGIIMGCVMLLILLIFGMLKFGRMLVPN